MTFDQFVDFHSKIRMERYLAIAHGDKIKALEYYKANIKLAQSAIPFIHVFEVAFRNAIHNGMSQHYNSEAWVVDLPRMELGIYRGNKSRLCVYVEEVMQRLKQHGKVETSDRLVSELSLGFWVELFYENYNEIIGNAPFNAFTNRQPGYDRAQCYKDLIFIRAYRNRISHHDSLFIEKKDGKDRLLLKRTRDMSRNILIILEQINPDLRFLAKKFDETESVLTKIALLDS